MDSSFSGEIMHFFNTTGVQFWKNLQETLSYLGDHLGDLLWRLFGVVFIFFCANLLLRWISYLTSRTMRKNRQLLPQERRGLLHTRCHSSSSTSSPVSSPSIVPVTRTGTNIPVSTSPRAVK